MTSSKFYIKLILDNYDLLHPFSEQIKQANFRMNRVLSWKLKDTAQRTTQEKEKTGEEKKKSRKEEKKNRQKREPECK